MNKPKQTSSYQRLKANYLADKEQHLQEIKTLLDGENQQEMELLKKKYQFLINQKKTVLFGNNQSRAGRRLNEYLSQNPE